MSGPQLHTLLAQSDFVVVACPLTERTKGLLGAAELAKMRRGAVLINIARGAVVNDLVYAPLKTRFLAEAEELGCHIVDGLGMLLHQAVPGFERWFGVRPEVDSATRAAALR